MVILIDWNVSRIAKKVSFWLRRRFNIPIIVVGTLTVTVLLFNDDTSLSLNMEYERQINELSAQIAECRDSAAFYRRQREAIIHGHADLEHMAREKFHMHRPTEDVFILK